jgi:hypothetical protein
VQALEVYLTDSDNDMEHQGHVTFRNGHADLFVPARSIVTLAPAAAPDEE